jgi:hypothetical protein
MTALIVPGFKYRPVSGLANDKHIRSIGLILHLAVSNAPSLFPYFDGPSGGIESTLWAVKKDDKSNGVNEQYRSADREADANLKANSFYRSGEWLGFTSLETQGTNLDGTWSDYQLATIKATYTWGHDTLGWKYRACPDPFHGGMGYHTMWGAPSQWTPVAKTCPGKGRIHQFNTILVPWLAEKLKESKAPPTITARPGEGWAALANRADVPVFDLYKANTTFVRVVAGRSYTIPE